MGHLPIALAKNVRLRAPVAQGRTLNMSDVGVLTHCPVIELRRGMERHIRARATVRGRVAAAGSTFPGIH